MPLLILAHIGLTLHPEALASRAFSPLDVAGQLGGIDALEDLVQSLAAGGQVVTQRTLKVLEFMVDLLFLLGLAIVLVSLRARRGCGGEASLGLPLGWEVAGASLRWAQWARTGDAGIECQALGSGGHCRWNNGRWSDAGGGVALDCAQCCIFSRIFADHRARPSWHRRHLCSTSSTSAAATQSRSEMSTETQQRKKVCFVTIGATATFEDLVRACTLPDFLRALHREGYTDLLVQYGKNRELWKEVVEDKEALNQYGVEVSGFSFRESGIAAQMQLAKGDPKNGSMEGVIVSHAGTRPRKPLPQLSLTRPLPIP